MPTFKEIKCRCKTNTKVELEEATVYVKVTTFMCDCGRTYLIRDYHNAMTSYGEVEYQEYKHILESQAEDKKRKKLMNPTDNGREMYQVVEKWLNALSIEAIANIEAQRTFHQTIDKEFVIETILLCCRTEDDLLEKLYRESLGTVDFNADNNSPQCFTDKKDWYIIKVTDITESILLSSYPSKAEAKEHISKLVSYKDSHYFSYACFSVPFGTEITV